MSACSSFLEEYSQDLARVENITDLDELLLGSAYLPAGKISSTSSGGSSMNGDPDAAQKHFDQLSKCTAVYLRLFHSGTPILRLAVAA